MKKRFGKISIVVLLVMVSILLVANLVMRPVLATPIGGGTPSIKLGSFTGPVGGSAQDDNTKASLDLAHTDLDVMLTTDTDTLAALGLGNGSVFYCDSGESSGTEDGLTWATATDTLDEAINLCTNNAGDVIFVAAGHAEATLTTQAVDVDVIGVTIIGLGNGSNRPTFTYTGANGEVAIGADNVTIKNILFLTSVTGVLMGIEVEDGVDYFTLDRCEFNEVGDNTGTDEFVEAVNFVNNNTGCVIQNCTFTAKASGAAHAIFMDADTDQTTIRHNTIRGDYSVACIGGDTTASTNLIIEENTLINGSLVADGGINAVAAIVLLDATAGLIRDNIIVSDVATGLLMRVADDMVFMNNWITDRDGDEFGGATETTSATITVFVDGG